MLLTLLAPGGAHAQSPSGSSIRVPEILDLPHAEIVNPERTNVGSRSVGTTSDGWLENAERLGHDGTGFFVLAEHRSRETDWGTTEMIGLLRRAGERLETARPGVAFGVGNIAVNGGGDIQWSRSHNNGRDADLSFMFVDRDGDVVTPETLYTVRRDLTVANQPGVYFDPELNWLLVDALVSDREARIQWLFVASFLEEAIVDWARDAGVPEGRINEAALVMHQPGDSLPHDDHLHLRIHCPDDDRLDGCQPYGPDRAGVDVVEPRLRARAVELARCASAELGDRCLEFLDELVAVRHVDAILAQLASLDGAAGLALIDVVLGWDAPDFEPAALAALGDELDPAVMLRLFGWLAAHGDDSTAQAIAERVTFDLRVVGKLPVRAMAAGALAELRSPIAVDALIEVLGDPRPAVRMAGEDALAMTTGFRAAGSSDSPVGRALLQAEWAAWYAARGSMSRNDWLSLAFEDAGYEVGEWTDPNVEALIAASADEDARLRLNAIDRLHELSGHACENVDDDALAACWRRRLR